MQVGLIQHSNSAQCEDNLATTLRQITQLAAQGAELIVLQELHRSQYFCQTQTPQAFDLAEPLDGPTSQALAQSAKQHNVVIIGSIFERRRHGLYHNTAIVMDCDGSMAGYYRKMHIPDDPGYHEKYYFTPGDASPTSGPTACPTSGFIPVQTSVGKLGVMICWDQWFPEAARLMALAGAEVLIYPTAIGWDMQDDEQERNRQLDAWVTIQRSHAIANNLPVISVNRVGHESDPSGHSDGIHFWGNSFACDAMGKVLTQCSQTECENAFVDINLAETKQLRRIWPYLRDRRIDAYSNLTKRAIDDTA